MIWKLRKLLFIGFVLHLALAIWLIVLPTFLPETRLTRIYKTYLLPGPFFKDDRITTSYNLIKSWKDNGQWSEPLSHSMKYFNEYYESYDPRDLYMNRYVRFFDQVFIYEKLSKDEPKQPLEFKNTIMQNVPYEVDSIHVIVTKKCVEQFSIRIDTVFNAQLDVSL